MATIRPFRALRPHNEYAAQVASKPYDVLNSEEARKETMGNPISFLHITKSEIDLPADIDIHSEAVYRKRKKTCKSLLTIKFFFRTKSLAIIYMSCNGKDVRRLV